VLHVSSFAAGLVARWS